jgi:hypothetical protein
MASKIFCSPGLSSATDGVGVTITQIIFKKLLEKIGT